LSDTRRRLSLVAAIGGTIANNSEEEANVTQTGTGDCSLLYSPSPGLNLPVTGALDAWWNLPAAGSRMIRPA
jgi:hypothetical protein